MRETQLVQPVNMSTATILRHTATPLRNKGFRVMMAKEYRPVRNIEHVIDQYKRAKTMEDLYEGFHSNVSCTADFSLSNVEAVRLQPRTVENSRLRVRLPLSTDAARRLKYSDHLGNVRLGRLLEDMDIVAPCCCYMHNRSDSEMWFDQEGSLPRTVVTARLHEADFSQALISATEDIYLDGEVTWTNENTIEATVTVLQNEQQKLQARFIMVSLNAHDLRQKMRVHQLQATTQEEMELLEARIAANAPKKRETNGVQGRDTTEMVTTTSTSTEQTVIVYPEFQNPYGTAFGGYLLRLGMETAKSCATVVAKEEVRLVSMKEAVFLRVVPLGSVLRYRATLVKTVEHEMHISVLAEVLDVKTQTFLPCDKFSFVFASAKSMRS